MRGFVNTLDLAYLTGAFLGDGCIYTNLKYHTYQFSITSSDRDLCEICQNIFKDYFNKSGRIKDIYRDGKYSYSQLVVCSKHIVEFFDKLTNGRKIIPFDILSNLEHVKELIKGLMDTDGWISKVSHAKDGYIRYRVGMSNTAKWVYDLQKMLKDHGVQTGNVRILQNYRNGIKNKDSFGIMINTEDYCNKIGFRIKRKQDLAQEYINYRKEKDNERKKNL